MPLSRRTLLAALAPLVLAACTGEMMMMPDDPRLMNARVEIVGSSVANLRYDAVADLPVRYVTEDGDPIEDARLEYAIVGEAEGSRLQARELITDADGAGTMSLTAGRTSTMFTVEVTPPAGDGASFSVSVAGEDQGGISVRMSYEGDRELLRFDAHLIDDEACASLDPHALPALLQSAPSVGDVSDRPGFAGLEVRGGYTVVVLAYSATHLAAYGCADAVVVVNDMETEVDVPLADQEIPPEFAGTYDLDNRFDFGGALPPSVEAVVDALGELADDDRVDGAGDPHFELTDDDGDGYAPEFGQDPGAFVTDLAMRQTCRWECLAGEEYDNCSMVDHTLGDLRHIYVESFDSWDGAQSRFFGGCGAWEFAITDAQNLVNAQVAANVPDFALAWTQLASDLSRALNNAHILSELTVDPGSDNEFQVPIQHELTRMVVDFEDPLSTPPGMMRSETFLLADAGFTGLGAEEVSTVDGDVLTIPQHSFDIDFGRLTLYIYREVLLPGIFGVSTTGELLGLWVDCVTIAARVHQAIEDYIWPLPSPVTEAELQGYCEAGLDAAGVVLEEQLADELMASGTLTIEGTARGSMIDPDTGRVDELVDGVWTGTFTEDDAGTVTTGDVTGTFSGPRRAR